MDRYDPYTDTFIHEGWICPRCGRVMAPWMPYCDCKIKVTYTKESSTTAPTGTSYTIKQSSDTVTVNSSDLSTKTIHDGVTFAGRTMMDGWESELYMKELEKNQRHTLKEDDYE